MSLSQGVPPRSLETPHYLVAASLRPHFAVWVFAHPTPSSSSLYTQLKEADWSFMLLLGLPGCYAQLGWLRVSFWIGHGGQKPACVSSGPEFKACWEVMGRCRSGVLTPLPPRTSVWSWLWV